MTAGIAAAPIRCDGCGSLARRRIGYMCPEHWFFIESVIAHSSRLRVHVVYACSEARRDPMWKRGPGPDVVNEDGTRRMRAQED